MTAFGFPVGPFVVYDEVGLQVAHDVAETLGAAFGSRFPKASVVDELVAAGETGRKAGRGFYLWPVPRRLPGPLSRLTPGQRRVANPAVYRGRPRRDLPWQDIQDRLVLLFVNEAMRCLEEGVLRSPTDGDLGAVLGLGFPPFRGGPFHSADALGFDQLVRTLDALAERHGDRYAPTGLLRERARAGRPFFATPPSHTPGDLR
jgi:3-hydroxyacyl-CoA dehydrogenase/enoyl-CoA hydratase/3-hydroxybutyryl-CoA epimerase